MNKQSGFTLIELIMVIVILGILAAVAIPKYIDLSTAAQKSSDDYTTGATAEASATHAACEAAVNAGVTVPGGCGTGAITQ